MDLNRRKFNKMLLGGAAMALAPSFAAADDNAPADMPTPVAGQKAHVVWVPGETPDILSESDIDVCLHPASLTKLSLAACYYDFKKNNLFSATAQEIEEVERQLTNALITSHNGDATQVAAFLARKCLADLQTFSCTNATAEYRFTREILPPFFQGLGMTNTHFFNSSGLPGDETNTLNNRTTVRDLATLVNFIMQNHAEEVLAITSRPYFNERYKWGPNTNPLLPNSPRDYARPYEGVRGLKTGKTDDAGDQLATIVERDGILMASINCGATSKEESAEVAAALLDSGFETLERRASALQARPPHSEFELDPYSIF